MEISTYMKCPSCNFIFNDPNKKLKNLAVSAPCCGASNELREVWPSLDVHMLYKIVKQQDLDSIDGKKIAIVFTCTLLEMMLEKAVWTLIQYQVKTQQAAESILDGYHGREKRLGLFKKLSDFNPKDILEVEGYPTFLKDWKTLAQVRNSVIHRGNFGNIGDLNIEEINNLILSLTDDSTPVFALIHNEIIKSNSAD